MGGEDREGEGAGCMDGFVIFSFSQLFTLSCHKKKPFPLPFVYPYQLSIQWAQSHLCPGVFTTHRDLITLGGGGWGGGDRIGLFGVHWLVFMLEFQLLLVHCFSMTQNLLFKCLQFLYHRFERHR